LARQGLNGDYFGFYFCDVLLKINGKGGNPVFIKLLSQPSGRCTPQ
jgi:phospholipid/cholesterol/gamma-HCH transport system substrate-binding protein